MSKSKAINTKKKNVTRNAKTNSKSVKSSRVQKESLPKTYSGFIGLCQKSFKQIKLQPKFFGLNILVYAVLSVLLVNNVSSLDSIVSVKNGYLGSVHNIVHNISSSFTTLGSLSSTLGSSSGSAGGIFQVLLFVLFSLIFIRAIRATYKSKALKFSEGIYFSSEPLVQFFLVLSLIIVEMLPIIFSLFIYQIVFNNGIAASFPEKLIFLIICILLFFAGLYLIISSMFALLIVTLPKMRPVTAIRSSWRLVKGRRLLIIRRLMMLIFLILAVLLVLSFVLILIIPAIVPWLLLLIGPTILVFFYSYIYNLYRELL
jgi:hypothetical protein